MLPMEACPDHHIGMVADRSEGLSERVLWTFGGDVLILIEGGNTTSPLFRSRTSSSTNTIKK